MKIIIDTSAYIALLGAAEVTHKRVRTKFEDLLQERAIFFTSDYILDELFTRLAYDQKAFLVRRCVKMLHEAIRSGELQILRVTEPIFENARIIFLKYLDLKLSFTDATTVSLLRAYKLDQIFTLDSDFRKLRVPVTPLPM